MLQYTNDNWEDWATSSSLWLMSSPLLYNYTCKHPTQKDTAAMPDFSLLNAMITSHSNSTIAIAAVHSSLYLHPTQRPQQRCQPLLHSQLSQWSAHYQCCWRIETRRSEDDKKIMNTYWIRTLSLIYNAFTSYASLSSRGPICIGSLSHLYRVVAKFV